jgi:hypothetical protein
MQPPSPGSANNILSGVTVVSPHRAWAVGWYSNITGPRSADTLIERWNGSSWKRQPSPNPGSSYGQAYLSGVAATSASNAWAVGRWANGQGASTLILHWDGTAWTHVPSPNPGPVYGGSLLEGVTATSPDNAWAVGTYYTGNYPNDTAETLIEHWDGTAWRHVPSPNVTGSDNHLTAVAATSPTNAWAVGYSTFGGFHTLIEHWDGATWKRVPSPDPRGSGGDRDNFLYAVTATSPADAWAVGQTCTAAVTCHTLILHRDGAMWTRVPSPNPGSADSQLYGVTATSPTSAWAVGRYASSQEGPDHTLILRWNGAAWARVPSPSPSPNSDILYAVSAASAANIWAVGDYTNDTNQRTLALHCC